MGFKKNLNHLLSVLDARLLQGKMKPQNAYVLVEQCVNELAMKGAITCERAASELDEIKRNYERRYNVEL